jgi:exopolysaccharide production protein ExoZ
MPFHATPRYRIIAGANELTQTHPTPVRTLNSVQYMRGAAALAVLAVHALEPLHALYPVFTAPGLIVNLFFVISGFLLVIITNGETRPTAFMRDRLARMVPLYWVATSITLLILWPGIIYAVPFTAEQVIRSYLFIPSFHPTEPIIRPVVPQGWTLNLEMLYYSIFALALFLPRRWQVPAVTAILVPAGLFGMIFQPASPIPYQWTMPIGFDFVAGMWIGVAWAAGRNLWPTMWWIFLGTLCFALFAWATKLPFDDRSLPYGMFLVTPIFVWALVRERRPGGVAHWCWPKLIGDASYAIYLFHFLAILALQSISRHIALNPWLYAAGVFSSGLAIGLAAHYWIERPLLWIFKRR